MAHVAADSSACHHGPLMLRFDHLVARNLGCSRAEARHLFDSGAVHDRSDSPIADGATGVHPGDLPLSVRVRQQELVLYDSCHVLLNKPIGCVTALRDSRHAVAYDFLKRAPLHAELRPIGRLDLDTTGLLLWTTDGTWLQRLTHPKRRVPRTYHAALARPFSTLPPGLTLADGHRPDITHLAEIDVSTVHPSLIRPDGAPKYATITISSGAYHEVRRIFAALGSHVVSLCRVSFGHLVLPDDLPPGDYRRVAIEGVVDR